MEMSDEDAAAILYDWQIWARPSQLLPAGDWTTWLLLAGRGFGKTRTGAEGIRELLARGYGRLGLIAPTAADTRDVMVEGESGILATSPPWARPIYEASKRRLTWPNGAQAALYSADEPERLRGPQHDAIWADELAAWRRPEAWDMAMFGLRLGERPLALVTTTPKPVRLVRELLSDPTTFVTRGSTYDNSANLAPSFVAQIVKKYEGTRLGRQELHAELLDDNPGALWKRTQLDALRVDGYPTLERIVIAIDPAVTSSEESDETGIVVAGRAQVNGEAHAFVLDDVSGRYSPNEWAQLVANTFRLQKADRVIAEVNNGGDLVEANLRTVDRNLPFTKVHASRGKRVRAEPIASLYEQGRVHHVGSLDLLEDQLCTWDPTLGEKSPDRLDALVWALTELMLSEPEAGFFGESI
ncbi:ATP-binding protein [Deinococcus irradiatisoli]|uniref:ATP-binding protein n=2 Tax=Deinococcus irradiatisoli TaxID=2202254 RepID=A0A2Z3JI32_9DEIO|nr:ATP-binding protein [Deinococcus irradiatisoli]